MAPPRSWFSDPKLTKPTPLTVDAGGRVYGHLASWRECHLESNGACITAPKSRTNYSRFLLGSVETAEGELVSTGPIVLDTSHADPVWDQLSTMKHYSDTGKAVADVTVGEDRHGIWVAGALRPAVTPAQVRTLRASPLSGDWRTYRGHLELVAALAVSSPGFPIERPRATALIASAGVAIAVVGIGAVPQVDPDQRRTLRSAKLRAEGARRFGDELVPLALAVALGGRRERSLVASIGAAGSPTQAWAGAIGAENELTGDGRMIAFKALEWAQFPLPLRWVKSDVGAHDGAVIVGRIDKVQRMANGIIWANGELDMGSNDGREVARQIAAGFLSGVSVDLDAVTTVPGIVNGQHPADVTTAGRVRGATLVAVPAIDKARIHLVGAPSAASSSTPAASTPSLPDLSNAKAFPGLDTMPDLTAFPGTGTSPAGK